MEKIEYRVRPVTRYIVTRYSHEEHASGAESSGQSETKGEFDNFDTAYAVGYALAKQDAERLGLSPGDDRVIFPDAVPPEMPVSRQI